MAEAGIDVLMRVVNKGRALQAESRTVFAVNQIIDGLRADFAPGLFCELREFNFSAGALSGTPPAAKKDESALQAQIKQRKYEMRKAAARRGGNLANLETVDIQPVEFTRIFDTASTLLFKALVGCETLDSVSIIKRKAAGTINSGLVYLRLDFTKVLMTDLEWKDAEHIIEETGTFIYREITVRYRPQKADGTLGPVIPMNWKMKTETT